MSLPQCVGVAPPPPGGGRSATIGDVRQPAVSKLPGAVSAGGGASLEHQHPHRLPGETVLQPLRPGAVVPVWVRLREGESPMHHGHVVSDSSVSQKSLLLLCLTLYTHGQCEAERANLSDLWPLWPLWPPPFMSAHGRAERFQIRDKLNEETCKHRIKKNILKSSLTQTILKTQLSEKKTGRSGGDECHWKKMGCVNFQFVMLLPWLQPCPVTVSEFRVKRFWCILHILMSSCLFVLINLTTRFIRWIMLFKQSLLLEEFV